MNDDVILKVEDFQLINGYYTFDNFNAQDHIPKVLAEYIENHLKIQFLKNQLDELSMHKLSHRLIQIKKLSQNKHDFVKLNAINQLLRLTCFPDYLQKIVLNQMITTNIIPHIISLLTSNVINLIIKNKILIILTNITYFEPNEVVNNNILLVFKDILQQHSFHLHCIDQKYYSMWSLTHICADSEIMYKKCHQIYKAHNCNIFDIIFDTILGVLIECSLDASKIKSTIKLIYCSIWCLANVCRYLDYYFYCCIKDQIIQLFSMLLDYNDSIILYSVCWAIQLFIKTKNAREFEIIIEEFIDTGLISKIVRHPLIITTQFPNKRKFFYPPSQLIEIIITFGLTNECNKWNQYLIYKQKILITFKHILKNEKNFIDFTVMSVCHIISNLNQYKKNNEYNKIIDALYQNKVIKYIMRILQKETKWSITKYAVNIIKNIVFNCDQFKQLSYIHPQIIHILIQVCSRNQLSFESKKDILLIIKQLLILNNVYHKYQHVIYLSQNQHKISEEFNLLLKQNDNTQIKQNIREITNYIQFQQNEKFLMINCSNIMCNKTKYRISNINDNQIRQYNGNKFKRCKRCNTTIYCSKKCQKFHWKKDHRYYCVPPL